MWPRSGGDRGNRSVISVAGPTLRRVARSIPLPASPGPITPRSQLGGGATATDGSLRVVLGCVLMAIELDGGVRWIRDLREFAIPPQSEIYASLPSVLTSNQTLVTVSGAALIIGAQGELVERIAVPMVDDSGPAPNTVRAGMMATIVGEMLLLIE